MAEERKEIAVERGERKADASVRFSNHSAGRPMAGIMEMVHNLVTYAKSKGEIIVESCGSDRCNYRFRNDGEDEKLPTFERLRMIAGTAGKSISAKEGISLCGVGTEIMGLASRAFSDDTIVSNIEVVRNKLMYGITLVFNGADKTISYEISPPKEISLENSYDVIFKGCKKISPEEIIELKRKIVDTMPDNGLEILFNVDGERCILKHQDFLYRNELKDTENYEKHSFTLRNGEPLTLELSDVSDLIKNGEGNEYEDGNQCAPSMSGGSFRYKDIATVCRGENGWKFSGAYSSMHPTRNNIRFDINAGSYIFNELHKETQVKTESVITLNEIKDEYKDTLKIYDENGEEYDISEISRIIKSFCSVHKTDKNSDNNVQDTIVSLNEGVDNGEIEVNDIKSTIKVLERVQGRMNTKTLLTRVLEHINNEERKPCYNCAE